mgnify:CR=1 FL=1
MQTSFSSFDFRQAMGKFATGVTIVTTPVKEGVHGMTANAFMSVSLDPPLVLVSVDKRANTHRYISEAKCFGVNILRTDQRHISNHFAGKPNEQVAQGLSYEWHDGIPVLMDCLANIACRLWANYDGGDHTLYVGEVRALRSSEAEPLLFFEGTYREMGR